MYDAQTPSSSSSSTPSGATTPVDEDTHVFVKAPGEQIRSTSGLVRTTASAISLNSHQGSSFSKANRPIVPRPPRLSLDTSKAKPIPALSSASAEHSPLGAFGPIESAEGHLRSLVTRVQSTATLTSPNTPFFPHSHSRSASGHIDSSYRDPNTPLAAYKRYRTSSLRSLRFSWSSSPAHNVHNDVDVDSDEEHETFWPRYKSQSKPHAHRIVPSISRSPSPPDSENGDAQKLSPQVPSRHRSSLTPTLFQEMKSPAHTTSSPSPQSIQSSSHTRSSSSSSCKVAFQLPKRPSMPTRPNTNLLPPRPSRVGNTTGSYSAATGLGALNCALAEVEKQSRLRTRCQCGVCGKMGSDFPRCPRCGMTWCSRECRISDAGKTKHTCRSRN